MGSTFTSVQQCWVLKLVNLTSEMDEDTCDILDQLLNRDQLCNARDHNQFVKKQLQVVRYSALQEALDS